MENKSAFYFVDFLDNYQSKSCINDMLIVSGVNTSYKIENGALRWVLVRLIYIEAQILVNIEKPH